MPTKRGILETLSMKELQDIASLAIHRDTLWQKLPSGDLHISTAGMEVARHV